MFDLKDINTKQYGNRAKQLLIIKAKSQTHLLESTPFNITNSKLQEILDDSDFSRLRKRVSKEASLEGYSAVIILPHLDSYIVSTMKVTSYKMIGKIELEVTGTTGSVYNWDGEDYPITLEYKFSDDHTPRLRRFISVVGDDEGNIIQLDIEEPYVFKGKKLPVEIIFGNEDKVSDAVSAHVTADLKRLNTLDNELLAEWNRTRTLPYINPDYTDQDGKKFTEKIDSGKVKHIESEGLNDKLGNGIVMLPASQGSAILIQNIIYLEDRIKAALGLATAADENATNKHNLEMVIRDPFMTDGIRSAHHMREKHWQNFFNKICAVLDIEKIKVELKLSFTEQAKEDFFAATLAAENAKAKNNPETPAKKEGE